jgi:hypothetical protein
MTFSEFERDEIRSYLGFPRLYISANPFLESAITTIQPISEGGSAPDSSIEDAVRAALQAIAAIDGYITQLGQQTINLAVYEVPVSLSNGATLKQDYRMALSTLRREGTNQIMKVAIRLGVQPLRPYFYSDGLGSGSQYANPKFFGRK